MGSPHDLEDVPSIDLPTRIIGLRKLIYVAGLGHSGSTVLDMLLATGGRAVSLGQIWTVIREDSLKSQARHCTCGASAPECIFWGPILRQLASQQDSLSEAQRYQLIIKRVDELYGGEMDIIDSSKQISNIASRRKDLADFDIRVVHNVKDVRSFTISMLDNAARKGERRLLPEWLFMSWYRTNRAITKSCQSNGIPVARVAYEGVCLRTKLLTERMAEFLGAEYIDSDAPLTSGAHIISGNRFRLSTAPQSRLTYDFRWFARQEWLRPYALMPWVRRYNEECVGEWASPESTWSYSCQVPASRTAET